MEIIIGFGEDGIRTFRSILAANKLNNECSDYFYKTISEVERRIS